MVNKNIVRIISDIPENVKLVAISKTKSNEDIMLAYETGQRVFGENKIQEMSAKYEDLPKDIKWHMVGHVQSNKIKYMAPYVDLIHGIDSLKSIKILNKEGVKNNRILNCLLQLKISKEESKFGLGEKQFKEIIYSDEYKEMKNVKIKGLMAMASNTNEKSIIRSEFVHAKKIFDEINNEDKSFEILSMGMSNDYKIAIECGSNMIRLGSLIFGERNY
jgi:pyridoxal phosphate enzyme (YggS family)